MLRFINAESKTIVGAAVVVGVLSFASRIVGLVRDRILAGEFGAGDTLDIYYAAFKIPDLLFALLVVGALSASFIPLFTKSYIHKESRKRAWKFANNTLHIIGISMIVISVILFVFANPLSQLIAPGFHPIKQASVASFTRVMLLAQILLAGSMIFGSVLQSLKRFALYALAPVLYNIGIIIGALWFVDIMGPIGLAWGVVFGAFLHLFVQYLGCYKVGYDYEFSFKWKDKDTRELLKLTGPRMLGIAINQIMFVILTVMASLLAVGSVTVFQFAYNIQFFPVGIIGVSYAIAAFPSFSEHLEKNEIKKFVTSFSATIRQIIFFMIPMMILFLILRAQIVRVVVGAGAFDWTATVLTADTLAFFALTFVPQALVFVIARAFFALHDTVTPLIAGLVATLVGIVSAFLFTDYFGVIGLGMAYSLAAIVNALLLWVLLRQRIGTLDELRITQSLFKMTVAGLAAGVVMQTVKPFVVSVISLETFFGVLSQGFIAGGLGLAVYVIIAYSLKTEELNVFLKSIQRKILRKVTPDEVISKGDGPV